MNQKLFVGTTCAYVIGTTITYNQSFISIWQQDGWINLHTAYILVQYEVKQIHKKTQK